MRYNVSASSYAAHRRWAEGEPVTEDMAALKVAVAAVVDSGIHYTRDVYAAVVPQFEFTEEELARERGRVEHGVVGMEIYYARDAVQRERAAVAEQEARSRLALKEGDILPTMKISVSGKGHRVIRKAKVTAVGAGAIAFDATLGGRRFSFTASAMQLENGIRVASRDCL